MKTRLTIALRVFREEFIMEHFIGSDDIFAMVGNGSFWVQRGDKSFTVHRGEGFLFRKNELYHRRVLSPVTLYLFRYKSEGHAFEDEHVIFRDKERVNSTIAMLEQLEEEELGNNFEYRCHLFDDLILQDAMKTRRGKSTDLLVDTALQQIRASLHRGVDLKSIAAQSGLSYVQFLRRFKQATGIPPTEYIIELRLKKAKALLIDTDLLVKEIAIACGFENEYYFSNFFKKHTSLSPSAFRSGARM